MQTQTRSTLTQCTQPPSPPPPLPDVYSPQPVHQTPPTSALSLSRGCSSCYLTTMSLPRGPLWGHQPALVTSWTLESSDVQAGAQRMWLGSARPEASGWLRVTHPQAPAPRGASMSLSGQAPGHTCLSPPPPAAGGNASPRPQAEGSSLLTEISPYAKWFARAQGWTLLLCMEADMEPSLMHRGRKEIGGDMLEDLGQCHTGKSCFCYNFFLWKQYALTVNVKVKKKTKIEGKRTVTSETDLWKINQS